MNDRIAAAFGVVGGIGVVAFVAGAAALAASVGGVWAGIAVAGLSTAVFASVGLFALSLHTDDEPIRP